MNRYTLLAVAFLAGTAVGQTIVIDGKDGRETVKNVTPETKGATTTKKGKKKGDAEAKPAEPKVPTFKATGGFESSKDKARDSAVRTAVEKLHEHLRDTQGIERYPTQEIVRKMLLEDQEQVQEELVPGENGRTETMYRMTVAVCVEPKHVRELRSRERSSEALWMLAGLGAVAGVLGLFFKVDAWTKGYLSRWLVLGGAAATALTAGMWWMAK